MGCPQARWGLLHMAGGVTDPSTAVQHLSQDGHRERGQR